jgi:hypothetical protein
LQEYPIRLEAPICYGMMYVYRLSLA